MRVKTPIKDQIMNKKNAIAGNMTHWMTPKQNMTPSKTEVTILGQLTMMMWPLLTKL